MARPAPAAPTYWLKADAVTRRKLILVVVLFAAGMLVGKLVRPTTAPHVLTRHATPLVAHTDNPKAALAQLASASQSQPVAEMKKQTVSDADQLLRAGSIAAAAEIYDVLAQSAHGIPQLELVCRRGICHELQGDFESALADYRAVVGPSTPRLVVQTAQLGQARILIGTQLPDLAKPLLYDLIASSPSWISAGDAVQKSAQQLLACVYANEAAKNIAEHATDPGWIARPVPLFPVQNALELLLKPSAATSEQPTAAIQVASQSGKETHELLLTILTDRLSVQDFLQLLASATHLRFEWSMAAQQETLARTTQLAASRLSLPNILDAVLDPIGCTWETDQSSIRISRIADVAPDALDQQLRLRAVRTLRQVISAYPEDLSTPVAYLALANISLANGETDAAIAAYERLLTLFPRNPIKAETCFNLAKARMLRGDNAKAMESFYHVVDSTPGRELEPLAYLYLGRLMLEDGEPSKAIKPLVRAVALASDRRLSNASVLTLAAAYLFDQQPIAANQVLMEHSEGLQVEPDRDPAAFLAAVAAYRIATSPSQLQREGRRLLGALPHVDPAKFFGNYGYSLLGEAYSELQLEGPATEVYEKALKQGVSGFLGDQVTFELAALRLQRGEIDKARTLLNKLKAGPRQKWAVRSRLQLAEISYQAGKDDECLDACRQLLADTSHRVNKPSVLRIMGRVYERQGNHEKAAMCFGGLIPTDNVAGGAAAEGVVN